MERRRPAGGPRSRTAGGEKDAEERARHSAPRGEKPPPSLPRGEWGRLTPGMRTGSTALPPPRDRRASRSAPTVETPRGASPRRCPCFHLPRRSRGALGIAKRKPPPRRRPTGRLYRGTRLRVPDRPRRMRPNERGGPMEPLQPALPRAPPPSRPPPCRPRPAPPQPPAAGPPERAPPEQPEPARAPPPARAAA